LIFGKDRLDLEGISTIGRNKRFSQIAEANREDAMLKTGTIRMSPGATLNRDISILKNHTEMGGIRGNTTSKIVIDKSGITIDKKGMIGSTRRLR